MFFSRSLLVVFKTTGGRAWNPPSGLKPLTASQKRNRKKNLAITMKNLSILKMAEAHQPAVPVRLFKPLHITKMVYMKKKLEEARQALGWTLGAEALQQRTKSILPSLRAQAGTSLLPLSAQAALRQAESDV